MSGLFEQLRGEGVQIEPPVGPGMTAFGDKILVRETQVVEFGMHALGPLEEEIRGEAHKFRLDDAMIFAGSHSDLQGMYAAMDAFVFPSLYEGLN